MAVDAVSSREVDTNAPPQEKPPQEGNLPSGKKTKKIDPNKKVESVCNKSNICRGIQMGAIVLAIVALVAGVFGVLAYVDVIQLGITGIGALSATTGLYIMLTGFGVSFITAILLGVSCIIQRAQKNKEEGKAGNCLTNLCNKTKQKQNDSKQQA